MILLEDFAREEVDEATVTWFATLLRSERARALISPVAGQLVTELLSATDVMLTASGLLRAADLAVFELGMWQSWTGR